MTDSIVIYDIEIEKGIPPKRKSERLDDIEYCEGWDDHVNMGIACLCAYDYVEDRYRAFCRDNLDEFRKLVESRAMVVGFNHIRFDNAICFHHGIDIDAERCYDILREGWHAAGLNPDGPFTGDHGGFGLDRMAVANFGSAKTGHGAAAPVDWQRGRYGSVVDYCLADVWLTKRLFDRVLANGMLNHPKRPTEPLALRAPWSVVPPF